MELAFFGFFSLLALAAALSLILQKNPVYSALSLIVVIASMGGLFLLMHANFLAVLQVVVYAGAIMALFLFVVMVVDAGEEAPSAVAFATKPVLVILLVMAVAVIWAISSALPGFQPMSEAMDFKALSRELYTGYVFPFEAISVLIISSVIGALYIARNDS